MPSLDLLITAARLVHQASNAGHGDHESCYRADNLRRVVTPVGETRRHDGHAGTETVGDEATATACERARRRYDIDLNRSRVGKYSR